MAEIVNLRRTKKPRARQAAEQQAAENRVRHGRTAAQKRVERLQQVQLEAVLDGARRDEASKV